MGGNAGGNYYEIEAQKQVKGGYWVVGTRVEDRKYDGSSQTNKEIYGGFRLIIN